jgi:hypothetical protein
MSTPPLKRLFFPIALVVLLYGFTELLSFVVAAIYHQDIGWVAASQAERDELRAELEQRPGLVLQVHPYVGYLETPPLAIGGDASGQRRAYPVNAYGYGGQVAPVQPRTPDRLIVGIMGGSVAWSFHMFGTARLRSRLQADPAWAGKEIVFVNLAVSGYKQPQQLMTLNYLLVLGAQFDMIINVDGFNEVALYEAEDSGQHAFPAFPRSWATRVEVSSPRVSRYLGRMETEADHRLGLARGFSRPPWRYSPLANFVWRVADSQAEIAIRTLQEEYRTAPPASAYYTVKGPGWTFATRRDLYGHLAALWKNSSLQLGRLCAANQIRYYHFLQPTLLVSGSKPLTPAEAHMAKNRDQRYRPGVEQGYPLLIEAGRDLKTGGERFADLTGMFAGHPEAVYLDLCHLNQAGNDLLADRISEAILSGTEGNHSWYSMERHPR